MKTTALVFVVIVSLAAGALASRSSLPHRASLIEEAGARKDLATAVDPCLSNTDCGDCIQAEGCGWWYAWLLPRGE